VRVGEPEPYLYVRASIPVASVLSAANRRLLANLGLLTFFFLLVSQLAWFIGKRSIADRVALLEAASRRMAGGDLQARVADSVKGGELGSLGQTFDQMALQRQEQENKLIDDLQRPDDDQASVIAYVHPAEDRNEKGNGRIWGPHLRTSS
jgi:methyl-accepting chemotaxis protein